MGLVFSKVFIGSDHGGFELKCKVLDFLNENFNSLKVVDCGTNSKKSVDYPLIAKSVITKLYSSKNVSNLDSKICGILICTTGIGMSVVANKFKGIRAALCSDSEVAKFSRLHNNANVLVLSGGSFDFDEIKGILVNFLTTKFSNEERHIRRINEIFEIEKVN